MYTRSLFRGTLALFLFIVMLIHVKTSYGQFFVESTSPAHGATSVDTIVTISITFNSAIDTSARFPDDFFINAQMSPEAPGGGDSLTVSPDQRTVSFHNVTLSLNTMYVLVIVDAVSQGGDSLDMPYSMAFTTGSNLPTASVSGTISYPGNDPTGAMVMLFDNNPMVGGEFINGAVVPSASGNYTVDYVEAGIYWPLVLQNFYIDDGGDIQLRPSSSAVGFYDPNGDGNPDSIEVTGGATISNIDVTLFEAFPQTARDPFANVESLAQAWAADAHLVHARSEWIGPDGNSHLWLYFFYSPLLMQHQGWLTFGNGVVIAEPQDLDTVALPSNWLNSDSIMSVAEANGGSNFRQQYPDAWVIAQLGHSSSHQGLAVWVVEYSSDYDFLEILIDALTGDIVIQTIIPAGDVSGTWTVSGSPYLINGEITIPFLETLTIEPGVLVEFQGHYRLNVEGRLLAIGTETDTIVFTVNDTTGFSNLHTSDGGWHGIRFNNTSSMNDSSKFVYCKLQYGKAVGSSWPDQYGGAIFIAGFDKLLISNCLIINNSASGAGYSGGGGVSANWCNLQVDNCTFIENKALDTLGSGGAINHGAGTYSGFPYQVKITNSHFIENAATSVAGVLINNWGDDSLIINVIIDNCEFINNVSDRYTGLSIHGSSFTVSNSVFTGNTAIRFAAGGGFSRGSSGTVSNCLFASNVANTGGGNWNSGGVSVWSGANVDFINSTFANNSAFYGAGLAVGMGGIATTTNSIFWGNSTDQIALDTLFGQGATLTVSYCSIQGGQDSVNVTDPLSTLIWGDGNIDGDPLFVDPLNSDYHLQESSSCIGAAIDSIEVAGVWYYCPPNDIEGNPRPNPPGTRPDMGAYESEYPVGIEETVSGLPDSYFLLQNYPNPFNPSTTIEFAVPRSSYVTLKVFNVLGQEVATLVDDVKDPGTHETSWDASSMASGVYFYRMRAGDPSAGSGQSFVDTKKLILLR